MNAEELLRGLAAKRAGEAERMDNMYAEMRGTVGPDYDYSKASVFKSANGHSSDVGKLPNHPTFSTESEYSNGQTPGGRWGSTVVNGQEVSTYTPSPWMVQNGNTEGLANYMTRHEPGVKLLAPAPYRVEVLR